MGIEEHFVAPFLTATGWRLVIASVEYDGTPGLIPDEPVPVSLYGYLFPPPLGLNDHQDPEPPRDPPTTGDVTLPRGCILIAPPPDRDA